MEKTSRAIIKIDNNYIFMKREKRINDELKIFYTTIGGHVEENESFEEACIREVYEELGIDIKINELFFEFYNSDLDRYEKFYLVDYVSGKLGTGTGEEFTKDNIQKYGKYEVIYIDEKDICNYNILPSEIKYKIINEK